MTHPQSDLFRCNKVAIVTTLLSVVAFIGCAFFIGFRFEKKKFKAFIATIVLALIYQIFFADVCLMFLKATLNALQLRHPWSTDVNSMFVGGPERTKYLLRRIVALKKQLELGPTFYKRNEPLTHKYKEVLEDLFLFGGYLLILFILIVGTRDTLMFYHTRTLKRILKNPVFSKYAINKVATSHDMYNFINGTIIEGLNNGTSYNGERFKDGGWTKWQIAKVLGVIRLRQIRIKSPKERKTFDSSVNGPNWSKEFTALPFKGKFWRIFKPWEYQTAKQTGDVSRTGKIYHQPGGGYVTLMGRNTRNSHRVMNFLHANHWIDSQTAVIIIEFTLYNVDADIFSLVKIIAEQTAFNSFVTSVKISPLKLLFNIDNLPWHATLAILLYFLTFTKVLAYVVLKMWFSPTVGCFLSEFWNYVDVGIVTLNLCIFVGLWTRESLVKMLLLRLETNRKNEFIPFSQAAFIDEACTVMIAFLVAITTIRLWKILQFARVFRMLTRTLNQAKSALSSTTFFMLVFIMGMGLSSFIINGSNSPKFLSLVTCISSLMSLSFGFTTDVSPSDLNHGGRTLGFILYAVLVVAVSIFLINMFITVLCLQFAKEKREDSVHAKLADYYTFWHFLSSELTDCMRGGFLGLNLKRRESEKAKDDVDILRLRGGGGRFGRPKENSAAVSGSVEHMRRLQLISDIVHAQMDLLTEMVGDDQDEGARPSSPLSEVMVDPGEMEEERPSTSKNAQLLLGKLKRNFDQDQLIKNCTEIRSP